MTRSTLSLAALNSRLVVVEQAQQGTNERLDAVLAALGVDLPTTQAPTTKRSTKKAAQQAPSTKAPSQKAPAGAAPVGGRSCETCGKGGLLTNTVCSKCRRAAAKGNSTPPAAQGKRTTKKVAVQVPVEAPAKAARTGRDASAHCALNGCSIFAKADAKFCTRHADKAARRAFKATR